MAIDPLTASLLTSGNANQASSIFGMDPALIQAQPEIQLGQQMVQQGTSTAPAYPGAAIARALQGAIGASLQKSGTSDLAKAYAGSADAMAEQFPKGTPLGDALRSPNPMVRMIALQQAPKALLMNSERVNLSPDQESHPFGGPGALTSSQPQSPGGKAILDAQRLGANGNQPAANALTSAVSKEGQIADTGVSAPPIPLTAQRPPVPPSGTSAVPPAAMPPPLPPQQQANAMPSPQQMADAKGQLADKMTQVAQSGVTNPTPTGIADLPGQIAAAKGLQKDTEDTGAANAKYYDSLRRGLSGSATIAAQQKQNIDLLRQVAASPSFTPGAGSDAALWLQRVAAQAGIKTAGAAPREIFNQVAARILADQMSGIKSMASETGEAGGRIFKPMLDLEEKANITPEDSLAGIKSKLDLLDNAGNLMMKWGKNANDYLSNHPRLDPAFENSLRSDIAASRIPNAVPGAPPAVASGVAASPHSPAEIQAEMRRRGLIK